MEGLLVLNETVAQNDTALWATGARNPENDNIPSHVGKRLRKAEGLIPSTLDYKEVRAGKQWDRLTGIVT